MTIVTEPRPSFTDEAQADFVRIIQSDGEAASSFTGFPFHREVGGTALRDLRILDNGWLRKVTESKATPPNAPTLEIVD